MAEVTYLLGAGASAQCLPVVADMGESIKEVHTYFGDLGEDHQMEFEDQFSAEGIKVQIADFLVVIKQDLEDLQKACETHYSIDTFAKKLYLKNGFSFQKLKATLSFYFTFLQLTRPVDIRYDNFWASVLDQSTHPPSKIKILSWNYDFQVEKSYLNMTNCVDLDDAQSKINMRGSGSQDLGDVDPESFGLLKLNGSARITEDAGVTSRYMCKVQPYADPEWNIVELIVKYYHMVNHPNKVATDLYFAWENNNRAIMNNAIGKLVSRTEVLVVIGYSFPFFNRKQDISIFENMVNLKKIYIQDLKAWVIKERLQEIISRDIEFQLIEDIGQFVFPKELEI